MKTGTAVAAGVGAGYLLGRTKKMKLAIALGVAAATGRAGSLAGGLLKGSGPLSELTPELGKLTGSVREGLMQAGKAAAVSAASGRIESVTERLHERAEGLRRPAGAEPDEPDEPDGDEPAAADEGRRPRGRQQRGGRTRRAAAEREEPDEPEDVDDADDVDDDADEDEPEEPASSARRRRPAGTGKAPVRRTRR